VLFISSHQFPYYPGTGSASETGAGAGEGYTLNVPMTAGSGDTDFEAVYGTTIIPAVERFRPEVMLISAGFDAHEHDPLGGLRLTTSGYNGLLARLDDVASRVCGRRIALITEGGYHLTALRECLESAIRVLD
jgi:acetoin utilization deacetylase AcuC-like enzyme